MGVKPGTVLFLVGPPGVGKTTLARALLERTDPNLHRYTSTRPKWTIVPGLVVPRLVLAGHYVGGKFDGADTVPYNGVGEAIEDWGKKFALSPLTVLDGDRFSHEKAMVAFVSLGARAKVALLDGPDTLLFERRHKRGATQNAAWLKGRETKCRKFAKLDGALFLDATEPTSTLVTRLENWLS